MGKLYGGWFIASGSSSAVRGVQWLDPAKGWRGFVENRLRPQINLGQRDFLLHCPFGRDDPARQQPVGGKSIQTLYRFDQYLVARQHAWLTDGFVEAIRPLTEAGSQIVIYLGTLIGAPEFDLSQRGTRAVWRRLVDSLAPVIEAGCDLAIDTLPFVREGDLAYELVRWLRSLGVRVYAEPTPQQGFEAWAASDLIVDYQQWQNVLNPQYWKPSASFAGFVPPAELSGEVVIGVWGAKPAKYVSYATWYRDVVPPLLAEGRSVVANLTHYFAAGGKLEELLPPDARAGAETAALAPGAPPPTGAPPPGVGPSPPAAAGGTPG